ncbi:hypothetical protein GCM10028895_55570 [Pontibacter rugosus]|nr:hypothetical protein [Rhodococcus wratislaviensis]GLK34565.1 hypothetical protein GCM10017611_14130 [Rhodococcus wratislaviensis]
MRLDLSAPRIGFDGCVFVARLVEEEAGYVTFGAPGQYLDGWARPDTPHCDYCGKFRRRAKLYVLRHSDTGEIKVSLATVRGRLTDLLLRSRLRIRPDLHRFSAPVSGSVGPAWRGCGLRLG